MYCSLASIGHAAIMTILMIIIIIYAPTIKTYNVTRGVAQFNHKRPGRFYAKEKTRYPLNGKLCGPNTELDFLEKNKIYRSSRDSNPRSYGPKRSRCTDYTILAHYYYY